ncbi:MAG TPA: HAD-IA family hydrolase [Marinobacterium sp.]|nr:HAD-IA family hydrolase [Marinobacterium sp.]
MSYQLLIFDWDGTLIDSAARIVSSFQGAVAELGYPAPTDEAVRNIIGLGLTEAISEVMPQLNSAQNAALATTYSRHYLEVDQTPTALFHAVEEGLLTLREQGFRLAVATGKSRRGFDRVLAESGLAEMFEITRCADETLSKPHPLMLEQILDQTGVHRSAALMVGDTVYDMDMATNAGVDKLAVTYGVHSVSRLEQSRPTHQVDSFVELTEWIKVRQRTKI